MKFSFTIEGAAELDRQLATLGERVHRKVVRQAVREGQRPMLYAMRATALSMVGGAMGRLLAEHTIIRSPLKQQLGSYSLHVQLRRGVEEFIYTAWGAHTQVNFQYRRKAHPEEAPHLRIGATVGVSYIPAAIEYGHFVGKTYVAPIPFGRTAAAQSQTESIRRFTEELRKGLLREAIIARYK